MYSQKCDFVVNIETVRVVCYKNIWIPSHEIKVHFLLVVYISKGFHIRLIFRLKSFHILIKCWPHSFIQQFESSILKNSLRLKDIVTSYTKIHLSIEWEQFSHLLRQIKCRMP